MKPRFSLRPLLLGGIIGLLAAIGQLSGALHVWSDVASDRLFLPRAADPSIVLVAIDDASIQRLGRWPWDRLVHAELIKRIASGQPSVIGYDVNFPEEQNAESDAALADAIENAGNVVLPVELSLARDQSGRPVSDGQKALWPLAAIAEQAKGIGHTNIIPDADGIARRVLLDARSSIPTVSMTTASFGEAITMMAHRLPSITAIPMDASGLVRVNVPNAPGRAFPIISAADVMSGAADPTVFVGRIVLVGATAPDLHDQVMVPTSQGEPMAGVEFHASFIDTLMNQRWLRDVPVQAQAGLLVLLGLFIGLIGGSLRGRWSAPLAGVAWVGVIISAFVLFDRGWVLDIVWPTLTVIGAYAIVTLERRARAEGERRAIKTMFSRYVSPSVVEAILDDPARLALGGERRRMTVFFSDVRGFTTLAEGMSPEKLVTLLNAYLDRMTEIVFAHDGVLDKYIGDAVMAFWNAPFPQEDHARRAVASALAMRDALAEMNAAGAFNDKGRKGPHVELRVGAGINTGDMVVGNIGGKNRYDYTVIGDNVNLASRVEGLTKEYGVDVLVTASAAAEMGSEILARHLDLVVVKGKTEPIMVYEAMALRSRATPEQIQLASDYEAAHNLYLKRDFIGCSSACADILKNHPADPPTQLLLHRSAQFISHPPAANWKGEWVYTKK